MVGDVQIMADHPIAAFRLSLDPRQARVSAGCLDFVLSADPIEPGRINVYERWESDADLMKFRGSGPSSEQQEEIRDAHVEKYRISAVEAP